MVIKKGFAMIESGAKEVNVTFDNIGAFPLVKLTPYGNVNGTYWISDISNTGFTIKLSEEQNFDLTLAYKVSPLNVTNVMSSDGTISQIDELIGAIN